ncbi:MAG TPA: phosphoribosyltransferase family protein [Candidatus Limnocylindrales bacterium]
MAAQRFANRHAAGRELAARLEYLRDQSPVILGLPRGGVPVAAEVARALGAPLDVIVVRKVGMPGQPELAVGAIGEQGARVINDRLLAMADRDEVAKVEAAEREELERRVHEWRSGGKAVPLYGRTVVIVDDGIATGATAAVAAGVARMRGAARVVIAVPVAPPDAAAVLRSAADEVVVAMAPRGFSAVGQWYVDFAPTSNDEVTRLLALWRS